MILCDTTWNRKVRSAAGMIENKVQDKVHSWGKLDEIMKTLYIRKMVIEIFLWYIGNLKYWIVTFGILEKRYDLIGIFILSNIHKYINYLKYHIYSRRKL